MQDVRLLSFQSQLSSGVMRLGFDLKVIYFHALIIENNYKCRNVLIININEKCIKSLVSSNPNIVVGTKKNRLIETVLLSTPHTCLN